MEQDGVENGQSAEGSLVVENGSTGATGGPLKVPQGQQVVEKGQSSVASNALETVRSLTDSVTEYLEELNEQCTSEQEQNEAKTIQNTQSETQAKIQIEGLERGDDDDSDDDNHDQVCKPVVDKSKPSKASDPACLMSAGSHFHKDNRCRPCAFYHRHEGCENGLECHYCHLCPIGEIKKRKKAKQALKKIFLQHSNLFGYGKMRCLNQVLFNSANLEMIVDCLQKNKWLLSRLNFCQEEFPFDLPSSSFPKISQTSVEFENLKLFPEKPLEVTPKNSEEETTTKKAEFDAEKETQFDVQAKDEDKKPTIPAGMLRLIEEIDRTSPNKEIRQLLNSLTKDSARREDQLNKMIDQSNELMFPKNQANNVQHFEQINQRRTQRKRRGMPGTFGNGMIGGMKGSMNGSFNDGKNCGNTMGHANSYGNSGYHHNSYDNYHETDDSYDNSGYDNYDNSGYDNYNNTGSSCRSKFMGRSNREFGYFNDSQQYNDRQYSMQVRLNAETIIQKENYLAALKQAMGRNGNMRNINLGICGSITGLNNLVQSASVNMNNSTNMSNSTMNSGSIRFLRDKRELREDHFQKKYDYTESTTVSNCDPLRYLLSQAAENNMSHSGSGYFGNGIGHGNVHSGRPDRSPHNLSSTATLRQNLQSTSQQQHINSQQQFGSHQGQQQLGSHQIPQHLNSSTAKHLVMSTAAVTAQQQLRTQSDVQNLLLFGSPLPNTRINEPQTGNTNSMTSPSFTSFDTAIERANKLSKPTSYSTRINQSSGNQISNQQGQESGNVADKKSSILALRGTGHSGNVGGHHDHIFQQETMESVPSTMNSIVTAPIGNMQGMGNNNVMGGSNSGINVMGGSNSGINVIGGSNNGGNIGNHSGNPLLGFTQQNPMLNLYSPLPPPLGPLQMPPQQYNTPLDNILSQQAIARLVNGKDNNIGNIAALLQ